MASRGDKFFVSGNFVRAKISQIHWTSSDRGFVFLVDVWCLHGNAKIDSGFFGPNLWECCCAGFRHSPN